ncbi:hypothetical protein ACJIZ3_024850 [Penstemon smallii]|uniref:Low temperature viability protein n=1 Tax=Penstemon smallii TaxID=265156 RepID=A0ABD3TT26_9LAMI
MGNKKKFFDKKKSATFQLMARDTSDPSYSSGPSGDRIFVRVDNNQYTPETFFNDDVVEDDQNSIFADAPEDEDEIDRTQTTSLPDHVRKEILELGFPDDGYNYLTHLREIKNTGGGSAYYDNPKANFDQLPHDVKAYDASRVAVPKINDVSEDKSIYSVASKTVGVRLQKVLDPEVAAILDDSDSSKFESDVEDLEEDFILQASHLEGPLDEELDEKLNYDVDSRADYSQNGASSAAVALEISEKPTRVPRPLDEQFDLLELQEYGTESEEEHHGYMDEEDFVYENSLSEKLNNAFNNRPSELLHHEKGAEDIELPEVAPEVIDRCREYAEKYEGEIYEEVEYVEESSDESEKWDCESILSTYSTLDNHPGKIGAPEARRKKKLAETLSGASATPSPLIALKGRERLPVDFLPRSKKHAQEMTKDEKDVNDSQTELVKKKPRSQESKEEKKERKSAVKSERREARQMKKETKGLYKFEAQRAQKVAAFTGPSSIHLM